MSDELLFECWCIYATKLKIYKNRLEIGRVFGLSTSTIPVQKIASVHKGITGISFETTGGGKTDSIAPWNASKRDQIMSIVLGLIESH